VALAESRAGHGRVVILDPAVEGGEHAASLWQRAEFEGLLRRHAVQPRAVGQVRDIMLREQPLHRLGATRAVAVGDAEEDKIVGRGAVARRPRGELGERVVHLMRDLDRAVVHHYAAVV